MDKSKTNSGFLYFLEKIIRSHPLLYFITRYFIRYTNIFEEDANGVKLLKFKKAINIIDVGASDGIASKFFNQNLNVKKIVCYEPNAHYVRILRKLNIKNLIIKPYAIGNKNIYKKIFFPRYRIFSHNLDLIPYTYYDKEKLKIQLKLDLKIDLIKIDVNDNGLSVVKCLYKIIKRDKPALLIETDSDIKEIDTELKKLNYKKFSFSNDKNLFSRINKKFPLNTYFLKDEHLN
jgi:FkbM family methyltransferase